MTFKVFHQVGHNPKWNLDSFTEDSCGDGLVLSPVHQDPESVEKLEAHMRASCMFDPQFYLPSSQKRKLKAYSFFPETYVNGFSTIEFEAVAKQAADECIDFQLSQGFRNIVIPTRYLNQMYTDFIEQHERFSVIPFLEALPEMDIPVCLTLTLTDHMIQDVAFRNRVLNWVTKYPEIDQIYLIYSVERETKQIQSADFLSSALAFAKEIVDTGLELIIGYQNTESLLFTLIDNVTVSFGTFENTRIFSIDKFLVTEEERRGPKPRIYLPGLLNWVQFEQAKQIRNGASKIWSLAYKPSKYADLVLSRTVDPYFNQPELYKHHLFCMQDQFNQLNAISVSERATLIGNWIKDANSLYSEIEDDLGLLIEKHGNGAHLSPWNIALKYAEKNLL
jgi:hypothetical protein